MPYDPELVKRSYRITFRDGRTMVVQANNPADAKRIATVRRYHPGTFPDLLDKQRNVSNVSEK